MQLKKSFVVLIALSITLFFTGCSLIFNKIDNITVFRQAEPFSGKVQIRLGNGVVKPSALFEMRVIKPNAVGAPKGEFLETIKREGAKHGANILVFECGGTGTSGQTICLVYGYRE